MPIKPENKARYPTDWKQVRERILERAHHCCEWPGCGVANYAVGIWHKGVFRSIDDERRTFAEARQFAADQQQDDDPKNIVIVLTIAHLDHHPENCEPANLRAWCQRHHLAYDADMHVTNSYATRRVKLSNMELFEL